jgi:filamentous hemagglutinin
VAEWRIAPAKISDYLLNPLSPAGGPKARFFLACGFRRGQPGGLAAALEQHPRSAALELVDRSSPYGAKFIHRCAITTPNGRNPCIRTVWQLRDGDYWLVTAYPGP